MSIVDVGASVGGWLANEPTDPDHDLAASWHSYNFNACSTSSCWTSQIAPVIAKVPVITGEIGENDCADNYINPLMSWLDSEHASYLAWTWNTDFNCSSGPGLITRYDGTPPPTARASSRTSPHWPAAEGCADERDGPGNPGPSRGPLTGQRADSHYRDGPDFAGPPEFLRPPILSFRG